jgi:hypothetical protein
MKMDEAKNMNQEELKVLPDETVAQLLPKKNNRATKLIIGIALLLAIPLVKSTFASQIVVNTHQNIGFGQGATDALACDSDVLITPTTSFIAGVWYLETVTISNLNTGSTPDGYGPGCAGNVISLAGYDSTRTNIPASLMTFTLPLSGTTITGITGANTVTEDQNADTSTVTAAYASPGLSLGSNNVSGFSIQQQ